MRPSLARCALVLMASLALVRCGSASPPSVPDDRQSERSTPPPCDWVFSPSEDVRAYVEPAAERWAAATGCDVRVGEGGSPVSLVPFLARLDSPESSNGRTERDTREIWISETGPHPFATTVHEMGHALANNAGGHSEDGVMAAPIWRGTIDESSLALVCGVVPCRGFTPER